MARRRWTRESVLEAIRARQRQGLPLKGASYDDRPLVRAASRRFGNWQRALAAAGITNVRRYKWDRQLVIEELRAWARQGLPLRSCRLNKSLHYAVYQYFGSWYDALAAAGLEPLDRRPKPRRRHTPRDVIEEIQARQRQGLPLTVTTNNSLACFARRHFETWTDALAAAGLQPRRRIRWTKSRLLEELRIRHQEGQFTDSTRAGDQRIEKAARRYFGSWPNALVAVGILAPGQKKRQKGKWTRQTILEAIQDRYVRGVSLSRSDNRPLAAAAAIRFGSWHAALEAAGIQAGEKPEPRERWSRQRVVREIQARKERGHQLTSVAAIDRKLYRAARRHCGSWHDAMLAAGIVPPTPRPEPPERWSKKRVIREIQARYRQGLPLHCKWPENRRLAHAAFCHCGGWNQALVDAGIPNAPEPHQKWSRQRVIAQLQARHQQGLSLASHRVGGPLQSAAHAYFGGWQNALSAAGITRSEADT